MEKILALTQDHGSRGVAAGLRLCQHAGPFDGVEGEVGTGFLFEFEPVAPGREFVGPGLDGINVASRLVRNE